MGDTKWTPGPWRAEGPDEYGDFNILHDGDELAIAAVVSNMRPPEEVHANAVMSAAAPELYEALAMIEDLDFSRDDCPECKGIGEPEKCPLCFPKADDARIKRRKALAKARGESGAATESAPDDAEWTLAAIREIDRLKQENEKLKAAMKTMIEGVENAVSALAKLKGDNA